MNKDLSRLLKLFRPYAGWMMLGGLVSLAAVLANITLMGVSGWFITAMGLAGIAGVSMNYFTPAAIIRACAIIRTGGRYGERLITHEATFHLIARLRRWLFDRLEPLSPSALGFMRSGDLLSRMRGDIDTLERFYLGFLVPVITALAATILIMLALSFFAPVLALWAGLFLILAGCIIPLLIFKNSRTSEESLVNTSADMRTQLASNLQGMGELLLYDQDGTHVKSLTQQSESIRDHTVSLQNKASTGENLSGFLAQLAMYGILIISFFFLQNGTISPPGLVLLTLLMLASFEAVTPVLGAFQKLGGVLRAARRIFEIADQQPALTVADTTQPLPEAKDIHFENVTFAYQAQHKPVFCGLSFSVRQGQKLAVTGPTGIGKSSLINLLLRFQEPQEGQISIGRQDIKSYNPEDVRRCFAVLEQSPYIFNASIRENLLLGNPAASRQDMEDACKKAGIHEFIATLPQQYETILGEHGRSLSGGQVKRLALARVLLKKAPCIILDEPGEGLDYQMEQDILSRVIDNLNGASLILISHRHTALEEMDQVLNLEDQAAALQAEEN